MLLQESSLTELAAEHRIFVTYSHCVLGKSLLAYFIVESCPLTKLNGGLSRLHSADEDAVSWLTNYGK